MAKYVQINNMKLRPKPIPFDRKIYQVISPDGKIMEEFKEELGAKDFMHRTHDFVSARTRKQKFGE